jgi:thioredoxin 1
MRIRNFTSCLLTIIVTAMIACSQNSKPTIATLNLVSPQEFNKAIQTINTPKIILDVRTPAEYKKGHLENALLIDIFRDDFRDAIKQLDTNQTVFVYCGVNGRSEEASGILEEIGFKTIYDLDGGISAWRKQDLPVTTDAP